MRKSWLAGAFALFLLGMSGFYSANGCAPPTKVAEIVYQGPTLSQWVAPLYDEYGVIVGPNFTDSPVRLDLWATGKAGFYGGKYVVWCPKPTPFNYNPKIKKLQVGFAGDWYPEQNPGTTFPIYGDKVTAYQTDSLTIQAGYFIGTPLMIDGYQAIKVRTAIFYSGPCTGGGVDSTGLEVILIQGYVRP